MTDSKGSRRRATYDDVLNAPEHLVAELIDGELYTSPRPASRHALAGTRLLMRLAPFQERDDDPEGWWIVYEPELHLGSDVLVPDLTGWRRQRMPEFPDAPFFTMAPDWVCEVLSPSTVKLDRSKKLDIYARARVSYAWLLDPVAQTLEVLLLKGQSWEIKATYAAQNRVRAAPFDAIEIDLSKFWGETSTPASSKP